MPGLKLILPGPPRTKKTSNRIVRIRTKDGREFNKVMPSAAHEEWFKGAMLMVPQIKDWAVANQIPLPLDGPVSVKALVYREANHPGDLIGYLQAIGDFLQAPKTKVDANGKLKTIRHGAGIIVDDVNIFSWDGSRLLVDRARPRIEVEVRSVQEHLFLADSQDSLPQCEE